MSEETAAVQADPLAEFSPEQIEILSKTYSLTDDYEITEEELAIARKMFPTAKEFQVLRKILGIYTQPERGMTMSNAQSLVEADPAEQNKYVMESVVNELADVKVRHSLIQFYNRLRGDIRQEQADFFRTENKKKFEEEQRAEESEAKEEEDERTLPINV